MICGRVLCIEDSKSHFAASEQLLNVGSYHTVTATSAWSALTAFRAIPRIDAVVFDCPTLRTGQQLALASAMDVIRPGVPKLVVTDYVPAAAFIPEDVCFKLHISYVEHLQALATQLHIVIAASMTEFSKTVTLLQQSRELRSESQQLLQEMRQGVRDALEKAARRKIK